MTATQTISATSCSFLPESLGIADLTCAGYTLRILIDTPGVAVLDFYAKASEYLHDVLASKTGDDIAAVLLVLPSVSGRSFVCGITGECRRWNARVLEVSRPRSVDTSYALIGNADQLSDVRALHGSFLESIGAPLFMVAPQESRCLLRVKVDPGEHWFLRYPLGAFAKFGLDGFEGISGVQWIVSARTITEIVNSQRAAEKQLSSTMGFFQGARIILNTYRVYSAAADAHLLEAVTDLFFELAACLQDLDVRGSSMSLHWTLNPDIDELTRLLLDSQTRYVFADFEAEDGTWHTGEGDHRCHQPCAHRAKVAGAPIDLSHLRGRLGHIQALKVFHCNSLYDPYNPGMNPADEGTIAAALLSTGAYFVDASATTESPVDYVCSMLKTLLDRADIRAILWAQALAGRCNDAQLISRANVCLKERGFDAIRSN